MIDVINESTAKIINKLFLNGRCFLFDATNPVAFSIDRFVSKFLLNDKYYVYFYR